MSLPEQKPQDPFVSNIVQMPWQQFPGHFGGALSKVLVGPDSGGCKGIDFRISCYQPMAHVREHSHRVQEQIYFVLEGEGLLMLDGRTVLMRKNDYVFVPPGVRHSFTNEGTTSLVFMVATSPVSDSEVAD